MQEILLEMEVGHSITKNTDEFNYDSFISTKSRLKRKKLGEWSSKLHGRDLTIKRTK